MERDLMRLYEFSTKIVSLIEYQEGVYSVVGIPRAARGWWEVSDR
jgi:hypothetical protein